MTEEEDLQAQIAALTGRINEHRHQQHPSSSTDLTSPSYHRRPHASHLRNPRGRWNPYRRGGRSAYQPYTNRTLILARAQKSPPSAATQSPQANSSFVSTTPSGLVSAQGPGRQQLMTPTTFKREQKQLLAREENAQAAKRHRVNQRETTALERHVHSSAASESREVIVDGLRFQLRGDGSKLIRIHDTTTSHRQTPKKFSLANVNFCRTKHGNLVRINAVRQLLKPNTPPPCEQFTKHGTPPVKNWTQHIPNGNCPFGASCKFHHDPNKVAMCKTFLKTGACPAGDSCDLSHEATYHRVPACTHFLRGNCINDTCPYPHIRVSENAPVCRAFSTLFYCPLGDECPKRHLFVCADYANHGKCNDAKCQLPHPDHASTLRKAAARQAKTGSPDESDVSSDEEMHDDDTGMEDVDSDAAEEILTNTNDIDHTLSQQDDFVAFS